MLKASLPRVLACFRPAPRRLVQILFALDLLAIAIFLALHLAGGTTGSQEQLLMLNVDHSLPEILLYGKWLAVLLLLVWAIRRGGGPICAALAVTFLIILVDDSLRIHERGSRVLIHRLGLEPAFGLRAQDVGELLVWSVLGTIVLASCAVGLAMSTPSQRRAARPMLLTFVALVAAGVGVDMLNSFISDALIDHPLEKPMNVLMTLLEDGSELLLGTLAVWLAMRQAGLNSE